MADWLSSIRDLETGGASYCFWLLLAAAIFLCPLEKRNHWQIRSVACALAFMALGWLFPTSRLGGNLFAVILWYVIAWLLITLQCWCICRISPEEAFFCGINAVLSEHIGSSVHILLTVWLFNGQMEGLNSFSMLAYVIVYIIILLTFGRRMVQGQRHLRVNRWSVAVVSVTGLAVTVVLSMMLKSHIDPDGVFALADPHSIALLETGQWYAIFFCVSILVLQYVQQRELIASEKLASIHELWSIREKQYEMSRETIDMINRKCHDMKHQIAALMSEENSNDKKARYAREVEQLIEIYDLRVHTKNEALNTILMEKGLFCSMQGIQWSCIVDDSSLDFIDRMDLYVLLGNALDNAIEAVQRIEDEANRVIQLQICRKNSFIHIRLENSCEGRLEWKGSLPVTTKEDKASHGIGLESICSIAEKYGGYASASVENQAFILIVLIPIPSK